MTTHLHSDNFERGSETEAASQEVKPSTRNAYGSRSLQSRTRLMLTNFFTNLGRKGTYEYKPLPTSSSFRLLELQPGNPKDRLRIRLQFADWNDPPSYEPISYAWGDPRDQLSCECDGQNISITRSLYEALLRFRLDKSTRLLWADAVCINQSSNEEKSHQVSNMIRIYQQGVRTLIWLGSDPDGVAPAAFRCIETIIQCILKPSGMTIQHLVTEWHDSIITNLLGDYVHMWIDQLHALRKLYSLAWFKRLWVLQELFANDSAIMFWGSASTNPRCIIYFAINLVRKCSEKPSNAQYVSDEAVAASFMTKAMFHKQQSVLRVLIISLFYQTTLPHDQIYALLGMPCFKALPNIHADYSLSASQVFERIARELILKYNNLDVLWLVRHVNAVPKVLSWVNDWSKANTLSGSSAYMQFQACGDTEVNDSVASFEDNRLIVQGILIDEILSACEIPLENILMRGKVLFKSTYQRQMRSWLESMKPTAQYRDTVALHGALNMVLQYAEHPAEPNDYSVSTFLDASVDNDLLDRFRDQSLDVDGDSLQSKQISQRIIFWNNIQDHRIDRLFIKTAKGFLGIAREGVQTGDKVAIIYGASVPYIVRPHGDNGFLLVGEAYIHGFMFGEAHKRWQDGEWPDVKKQEIVLL